VDQIRDDHHSLRVLLAQIEAEIEEDDDRPGPPLTQLLAQLTDHLAKHFQREEQSDLYVGVPKRVPELADALAELKVQHGTLIELAIDARGAARRLHEARAEATELTRALADTLRGHERRESEIMQQAFLAE
jgi:hemerythrin